MTLNELYLALASKVYENDLKSQESYLSMVAEHRNIPVDYLLSIGCIFVPNNDYIRHYLGTDADDYHAGFYYEEYCNWTLFVMIPIRDLTGEVVGIVGWDSQNKYKEVAEGVLGLPMYKVSPKHVFPKEKFFLTDQRVLQENFSKRVVFVTDGVFDCISLNYRGIPAVGLLGSLISREMIYFLKWYDYIYLAMDNDAAGLKLYDRLNRAVPGVHKLLQAKAKDIEEVLRYDNDDSVTAQIKELLGNPSHKDYRIV